MYILGANSDDDIAVALLSGDETIFVLSNALNTAALRHLDTNQEGQRNDLDLRTLRSIFGIGTSTE